jgi:hypothetical protein
MALARFAVTRGRSPFLPNRQWDPMSLEPVQTGWVVLVTGFSFMAYVANRFSAPAAERSARLSSAGPIARLQPVARPAARFRDAGEGPPTPWLAVMPTRHCPV